MATSFVDIHPHIISDDEARYPRAPLFGKQSDWSRERPVTIEGLVKVMDDAGVQKAAIVQASTCYGFDNSYVCDSVQKYPGRFTAVGCVDVLKPDAPATIQSWMKRGLSGLRLFTGGSTAEFDTSALDDPASFPAWAFCGEAGIPICVQVNAPGLAQVAGLAKRFPKTKIILDHLSRPAIDDGPPFKKAVSLFALSAFENIYLKVTPRTFHLVLKGKVDPAAFFPKLVSVFGSNRLAWGSNFPANEEPMKENLELGKKMLSCLSAADQAQIFAKTAQSLYPVLKD